MCYRLTCNDIFLFFIILYSITSIIYQWDEFINCSKPIHYWLLSALLGIFTYHLGTIYFNNPEDDLEENEIFRINIFRRGYKWHSIITVGIVYPTFFGWTLLGTVWYIENSNSSQSDSVLSCFNSENTTSWYFLTWIVTFYVVIIAATMVISYAAILYYRQVVFERQYDNLLSQYGDDERPQMNFNLNYGLSPQQIVQTSSVEILDQDFGECSICIDGFKAGERSRVLRCGHRYHLPCIDVWLMQHSSCPLCKTDFNRQIDNT